MDKLKVLNKAKITELLQQGKLLRYETIYGKVYVVDRNWEIYGAVRFDTYLALCKELGLVHDKELEKACGYRDNWEMMEGK